VDVLGGQGVISQVYDLLQSNKSKFNTWHLIDVFYFNN
jgi:hypothetical protein